MWRYRDDSLELQPDGTSESPKYESCFKYCLRELKPNIACSTSLLTVSSSIDEDVLQMILLVRVTARKQNGWKKVQIYRLLNLLQEAKNAVFMTGLFSIVSWSILLQLLLGALQTVSFV
jgi:hypothetical protein